MPDVSLVRWPTEVERRTRLESICAPRLLLLEDESPPPLALDCLEDWVRVPATEEDVAARLASLRTRAAAHLVDRPDLDGDGVLRFGGGWVSLPPVEARLGRSLIERFGAVVSRDTLARSAWPDGPSGRNALDVHVLRLRRRLVPVGLAIKTVRSRGYLLEASENRQQHVGEA